jgi:hypothetical protein
VIGSSADEGVVGMREARFAVGEPNGRSSTVWKFSIHKNEAYILTRMFGSDAKASLHVSGQCQWSATETWVKKVGGRRNAAVNAHARCSGRGSISRVLASEVHRTLRSNNV